MKILYTIFIYIFLFFISIDASSQTNISKSIAFAKTSTSLCLEYDKIVNYVFLFGAEIVSDGNKVNALNFINENILFENNGFFINSNIEVEYLFDVREFSGRIGLALNYYIDNWQFIIQPSTSDMMFGIYYKYMSCEYSTDMKNHEVLIGVTYIF